MEEAPWRRNHGGGILEEESWSRYPGGIMEEESWRRNHGGGILEEESWRRYPGGGIIEEEEESWRMYPAGGIMEQVSCMGEESWRTHLGGIWDASGGAQDAPRRHPGTPY